MEVPDNWRPISRVQCVNSLAPVPSMAGALPHFRPNSDRTSRVSNYGVIAIDGKMSPATRIAVHDISRTLRCCGPHGRELETPARPLLNETAGGVIDGARTKHNGFLRGKPTTICTGERYHDRSKSGTVARQGFAAPHRCRWPSTLLFQSWRLQVADDGRHVPRRHAQEHGTWNRHQVQTD